MICNILDAPSQVYNPRGSGTTSRSFVFFGEQCFVMEFVRGPGFYNLMCKKRVKSVCSQIKNMHTAMDPGNRPWAMTCAKHQAP